ncbi:PucR family transcriptional regulator [Nocardioides alcanivorans]|uniref:PucR family transcriptional regulator n=1 Tax=Nocardioides alcanivorans TaxID=2897352 RepID=UPI001F33EFDE|nr:helix-turn-helix domain-containing protein [Nocardioides alcanivorans]
MNAADGPWDVAMELTARFDRLVEEQVTPDDLLRSAAEMAGCPVGALAPGGATARYDAAGRVPTAPHLVTPRRSDDWTVWLEREGAAQPHDDLLAQRVMAALRLLQQLRSSSMPPPSLGDSGLVDLLLSDSEGWDRRIRAAELSGIDPHHSLQVLVASTTDTNSSVTGIAAMIAELTGRKVHRGATRDDLTCFVVRAPEVSAAQLALDLHAQIAEGHPSHQVTPDERGPWIGIGTRVHVLEASRSREEARRALEFTSSRWHGRRAIAHEKLGALELITHLPVAQVLAHPDLRRLDEIAATESGAIDIDTLEAFFMYGTLRRAADGLHVHHSTVADRLRRIEAVMGWSLEDPNDRFKAALTLILRIRARSAISARVVD